MKTKRMNPMLQSFIPVGKEAAFEKILRSDYDQVYLMLGKLTDMMKKYGYKHLGVDLSEYKGKPTIIICYFEKNGQKETLTYHHLPGWIWLGSEECKEEDLNIIAERCEMGLYTNLEDLERKVASLNGDILIGKNIVVVDNTCTKLTKHFNQIVFSRG